MLAIVAETPGPLAEAIHLRTLPEPDALAEDEVSVRMTASTVNPSDAITVSGAYSSRISFPFVPGFEGVGVVDKVGPGAPEHAIGQRVLPLGSAGNWQQVKRVDHSWCVPVPADIPDEVACFAYINPLTAMLMVDRFCGPETRRVIISAANSTIAAHLADLLSARGIAPVGVCRGTSLRLIADASRWSAVIPETGDEWTRALRDEVGPPGADLIFECVGGAMGARLSRLLRPGGTLVRYGLLSGQPTPLSGLDETRETRIEHFRLRDIVHSIPRHQISGLFEPVFDHLRAGRLRSPISRRLTLEELPHALRGRLEANGKLLISFPGQDSFPEQHVPPIATASR